MLNITRYPETKNKSLQVSSAADALLLDFFRNYQETKNTIALFHDRFGYLACHLADAQPLHIVAFKSQEKALRLNLEANDLSWDESSILQPLEELPVKIDLALMKIPKSLELFKLYLYQIHRANNENTVVACGFMTKYFSSQSLKIAGQFFEEVLQTQARKKARLLILKKPKAAFDIPLINSFRWKDLELKQYLGVFSAGKVDYATQFLLGHLPLKTEDRRIMDLASGNGVIAAAIQQTYLQRNFPEPELHLLDDSYLALVSSKLNLQGANIHFHYSDRADMLEDGSFDLVVTNPPFHFEYEINTEISVNLFYDAARILKPGGRFVLVFNRHLQNYRQVLNQLFSKVELLADSPKFMVLECWR